MKLELISEGLSTNTHRKLYEEHREKRDHLIYALWKRQVPQTEIARLCGTSNSTISMVLKRKGAIP